MSSLPPPPPYAPSGYGNRDEALAKVSTPGLLLAIAGGLAIAGSLLSLLLNLLGVGVGSLAPGAGDERLINLFSGGVGIVFALLGIVLYGVMVFGALKMRSLESYGLAMAAAIIGMLPCSCPCCVITLPIGIWCLVVLLDANVKASFR
jgi:hypothetical protein